MTELARSELGGILVPVTTPFDPHTGDADVVALRRNLRWFEESGVRGVALFSPVGEGVLLDEHEREPLIAGARDVLPVGSVLLVAVAAESTRAAIRLVQASAGAGAEAVLLAPPGFHYPDLSSEALRDHFQAVADASPVPIVVHRLPAALSRVELAPGLVGELAKHPRIVGIQDSRGDLRFLGALVSGSPAGFSVFTGDGRSLYAALEVGAAGAVPAAANLVPRECSELFARWSAGDSAAAGRLQERVGPLEREIVGKLGVPGLKAALDAVGLIGGDPRPPLRPLRRRELVRVSAALAAAGLIQDA